jgi:hypothetical protein
MTIIDQARIAIDFVTHCGPQHLEHTSGHGTRIGFRYKGPRHPAMPTRYTAQLGTEVVIVQGWLAGRLCWTRTVPVPWDYDAGAPPQPDCATLRLLNAFQQGGF